MNETQTHQTIEEYDRTHPVRRPRWQVLEADMLANSRRDATRGERLALERRLWMQIGGG